MINVQSIYNLDQISQHIGTSRRQMHLFTTIGTTSTNYYKNIKDAHINSAHNIRSYSICVFYARKKIKF